MFELLNKNIVTDYNFGWQWFLISFIILFISSLLYILIKYKKKDLGLSFLLIILAFLVSFSLGIVFGDLTAEKIIICSLFLT